MFKIIIRINRRFLFIFIVYLLRDTFFTKNEIQEIASGRFIDYRCTQNPLKELMNILSKWLFSRFGGALSKYFQII